MKKLVILLLSVSMLMVACRSQRMAPAEPTPPAVVEETLPAPEPEDIRIVEERFQFDRSEDKALQEANTFFVILGSFIQRSNAERFMETLRTQGFTPTILISETGFHRVSVHSYNEETIARARVRYIRDNFPEYHDVWLLIRKQ